jgi:hypothetical protein
MKHIYLSKIKLYETSSTDRARGLTIEGSDDFIVSFSLWQYRRDMDVWYDNNFFSFIDGTNQIKWFE